VNWLGHADIVNLVQAYGYVGIIFIVGLESVGLPFFPGEIALVGAAIYAGTSNHFSITYVILAAFAGAALGASVGFWLGREIGFPFIVRYGPRVGLTEPRIKLAQYLFWRHGGKVVFFGRFVAVLRGLVGILAGASRMSWARFLVFNVSGAAVWAALYGVGAYILGEDVRRLSGRIGTVMLVLAAVAIVAGVVFLRRREKALVAEAERQFPGPLSPWSGLNP
jgi:membrane protein DedA with SNARE-associated domain